MQWFQIVTNQMSASPYVHCSWPQLVPVFPHWDIPNDIGGIPVPSSCRSINEWCYVDYWCSRWHVWTPNDLLILLHHSLWLRPKEDVEIQDTYMYIISYNIKSINYNSTSNYFVCHCITSNYYIHSIAISQKHAMRVTRGTVIQIKWMRSV